MTTNNTTKPKRRWLRFSLRTLMVFMCVVGVLFGLWSNSARKQREIVEWVNENGGRVEYENDPFFHVQTWKWIPVPVSWKAWLGRDYEWSVVAVSLGGAQMTIRPLLGFPPIVKESTYVTDLKHLTGLTHLRVLELHDTHVSNLKSLAELTNLRWLYLNNTNITKQQIDYLQRQLPHCKIDHDQ